MSRIEQSSFLMSMGVIEVIMSTCPSWCRTPDPSKPDPVSWCIVEVDSRHFPWHKDPSQIEIYPSAKRLHPMDDGCHGTTAQCLSLIQKY